MILNKKQKQLDEQFRLECLKLAAPLHKPIGGWGDPKDYPASVRIDAEKYYQYIKEHKVSD